ncbi:Clan MC, family M14, Zinc carboxypeptidase-like metallopeptidase [Trichomonas vaginalis G3]|uniref:Clan MC, family M14, Zinc carboxypeptidase-like metallopeptidase n=1 Tax=Trichomonas vaginalis (strain ATCC PRA-98 / G3) TaxID=412133 RepID=A2F1H6_TRIV3|nr:cytosolic carboxypeptidase family [Trichomonas vaginalis G3]EAY01263.1 Clan MC, family M14, Zinc carboxypeptidase-like metallopeptidase [Trichomonas vaginalis G3]KAI5487004.1 cytosolic carboxypeptidase family [Trichomonas vaginalis G3]|eukprot:XP_001314078.1 Clan MC, family M14, Zinc carboxypeptidase-like metallopeptidase [Trichomonas vaginalis G3]
MSSDSSDEDDSPPEIIPSTNRGSIHISHPGVPPPEHYSFATQAKRPKWPDDLWNSGVLIYDLKNGTRNQPTGTNPNDKTLIFDSFFESGNLSQVYLLSPDVYHCILEYDKNKSGSCQWFYFKMQNIRADTKYTFFISGFHKNTGLFSTGAKIFWYSEKQYQKQGYSWCRGGTNYAYGLSKHKKKDKRSTLQFQIKFPYDNDTVYFCYALPYTYTDLLNYINNWQKVSPFGSLTTGTLGKTLGGRDCPYIQITSPQSNIPMEARPCLFFTGRIHPGESNGSVVLHGLIDYLVSNAPGAQYLRDNFVIRIVPMVNIDGVVEGFYRISLGGQDLNRVWINPDPAIQPIVCKIKDFIFQSAKERTIAAYIDFHGHSRLHGTFAYGCPNDDNPNLRDKEKLFPRMLAFLCDTFSWSNCVFSIPPGRKAASRIVVRTQADVVQSFTIETSFGGMQSGPRAGILYDEVLWKEIGAKCGETLFHMFLGSDSPVTSYVKQELYFLSPNGDDEDDSSSDDEKIVECDYQVTPTLANEQVPPRMKPGTPMLKLSAPTNFFNISSKMITTTPPQVCAPKWSQLQFTEQ